MEYEDGTFDAITDESSKNLFINILSTFGFQNHISYPKQVWYYVIENVFPQKNNKQYLIIKGVVFENDFHEKKTFASVLYYSKLPLPEKMDNVRLAFRMTHGKVKYVHQP